MRSPKSFGQPKKPNGLIVRRVEGESMLPGLTPGQLVLARATTHFQVGDVIIVQHDGLEKIKRIEKQQGNVLYLLGDNAAASTDSRTFGWVPAKRVLAKVVWPRL